MFAAESAYVPVSFEASADLSSNRGCMLALNASDQVALCGDGALPIGVLVNDPDQAGAVASVMTTPGHTVTGKAGGAFAIGARLASDANGKFVTAASGDQIVGQARQASGGDGELVAILFQPQGTL